MGKRLEKAIYDLADIYSYSEILFAISKDIERVNNELGNNAKEDLNDMMNIVKECAEQVANIEE